MEEPSVVYEASEGGFSIYANENKFPHEIRLLVDGTDSGLELILDFGKFSSCWYLFDKKGELAERISQSDTRSASDDLQYLRTNKRFISRVMKGEYEDMRPEHRTILRAVLQNICGPTD